MAIRRNDASRARGSLKGVGDETEEIDNLLTKKHEVVHSFGWYMRKMLADGGLIDRMLGEDGIAVVVEERGIGRLAAVVRILDPGERRRECTEHACRPG